MSMIRNGLMALMVGAVVAAVAARAADVAKPQPKDGDKGQITGTIEKIVKQQVTVKSDDATIILWPYYKGKGFDHETMEQIEKLKVGDKVTATWTFKEHYRIDSIAKVEQPQK